MVNPDGGDASRAQAPVGLHLSGTIQSSGWILAMCLTHRKIVHVSENIEDFCGVAAEDVLGEPMGCLMRPEDTHGLFNSASALMYPKRREYIGQWLFAEKEFEVTAHIHNQCLILEMEPVSDPHVLNQASPVLHVRAMLSRLHNQTSLSSLFEAATRMVRSTISCDRVLFFKFSPEGGGEVVAETTPHDMKSYLGLEYPTFPLAIQSLELYAKTPLRVISDTHADLCPLIASPDQEPLDMSRAFLCGPLPKQLKLLVAWRVRGLLCLPIMLDGRLWGLFSCHNTHLPMHLNTHLRLVCELFGQLFSMHLQKWQGRENEQAWGRVQQARIAISHLDERAPPDALYKRLIPHLYDCIPHDGLAILTETGWTSHGSVLPEAELDQLRNHAAQVDDDVVRVSALHTIFDSSYPRARALIIDVMEQPHVIMIMTRGTLDPASKKEDDGPLHGHLRPLEEEAWSEYECLIARELRTLLLEHLIRQSKMISRRQQVLVDELSHRNRNLFSLVNSLVRRSRYASKDLDEYVDILQSRIQALANAHDLATDGQTRGVCLGKLLQVALDPYQPPHSEPINGFLAIVREDVAPMMALLIHELVTNAVKYGSLSVPEGRVGATWHQDGASLVLVWKESHGPPVSPPERQGMGLDLITRTVPYEFGGEVMIDFASTGLEVTFRFPLELVRLSSDQQPGSHAPRAADTQTILLANTNILILEDNVLMAMELEEMLRDLGCTNIDTCPTIKRAQHLLQHHDYHCALLDINLQGTTSFAIACELEQQNIPILFVSGYGTGLNLPQEIEKKKVLCKPVQALELRQALSLLLHERGLA